MKRATGKFKQLKHQAFIDSLEATILLIAVIALLTALTVIGVANWHSATWLVIASGAAMAIYCIVIYVETMHDIRRQYRIDYMSALREERTHDR